MSRLRPSSNARPKRWRTALLIFSAAALLLPIIAGGGRPPSNTERTRPDHPEINLRTRTYASDRAAINRAVVQAVTGFKTYGRSWRIKSNDGENIRVEVPVLFFTDDLIVTLRPHGAKVLLDVRSTSRIGRGDFGENRRHILQLLSALDEKLKKVS